MLIPASLIIFISRKTNYLIGVFAVFLIGNTVFSQNLVVNPSFEQVHEIVPKWSSSFSKFNSRMKHWESPTQGSPDILFVELLDKMVPNRPKVDLSDYKPRTGKFMVGIKTFGCKTEVPHCKEYLQVKLTKPLQIGETYYFEYWINPVSTSVKVNGMGLLLTLERHYDPQNEGLIDLYPIDIQEEVIDASNTWHKISGEFEADDQYAYLMIGNFLDDHGYIDFKPEPDGLEYGFYLIDDVLLKPVRPGIPV